MKDDFKVLGPARFLDRETTGVDLSTPVTGESCVCSRFYFGVEGFRTLVWDMYSGSAK